MKINSFKKSLAPRGYVALLTSLILSSVLLLLSITAQTGFYLTQQSSGANKLQLVTHERASGCAAYAAFLLARDLSYPAIPSSIPTTRYIDDSVVGSSCRTYISLSSLISTNDLLTVKSKAVEMRGDSETGVLSWSRIEHVIK
jgi:hypothetical protein